MASNNSGIWNETGDSLEFSIAPTYYQTNWFRIRAWPLFCYCSGRSIATVFIRSRGNSTRISKAAVDERLRVARELHDTLLQSFHGLLMRFQGAYNLLPGRAADARQVLETALDDAAQAITEARDAVQDLRSSTVTTNDLAKAVEALGEELAAHQRAPTGTRLLFRWKWRARHKTCIRSCGMKSTGLRAKRCATRSTMRGRGGSKWKSGMMRGSFASGCGMTASVLMRLCSQEGRAGTFWLAGHARARQSVSADNWKFGASTAPARKSS